MSDQIKFQKNPTPEDIDSTLREIYENEDIFFPIRIHYTSHEAYRKQLIHHHWHNEMEILLVTTGILEMTVENHTFLASAGDLMIIPSKLVHSAKNIYHIHCEFYAIVFNLDFLSSFKSDLIQQNYILPLLENPEKFLIFIKKSHELNALFRNPIDQIIAQQKIENIGYELLIKAAFYHFIALIYCYWDRLTNFDIAPFTGQDSHSYLCKKIIAYVEANFMKKITLENISQYIGFDRSYFCRFFKRHFEMPFTTYLNQYRIRYAEYHLLYSDKKIIDIAIESGFDNAAYFIAVFKKVTGYTPTHYRKDKKT